MTKLESKEQEASYFRVVSVKRLILVPEVMSIGFKTACQ
jgi:hypothetical protein